MLNRRQLILSSSCFILPTNVFAQTKSLLQSKSKAEDIELNLYNIHTGEHFNDVIFSDNQPITENLAKVHHLLRDFRQNESAIMDIKLLLGLANIKQHCTSVLAKSTDTPIQIISGYRSPITNKMLNSTSTGVAKKSLHMQGRAIDFRVEGIRTQDLFKISQSMKIGGTGKYTSSGFIHLDTGRLRSWG
ncbi:YcbK family protein [Marinicellulosiphila megalodicopiae]|uniref:YcbK family protein n=1 Tax=Marinicellulosiphila megalodicopiae TaxID=2724896 RepID=UPI003BAF93C2